MIHLAPGANVGNFKKMGQNQKRKYNARGSASSEKRADGKKKKKTDSYYGRDSVNSKTNS